jgi:hypothetical protein
MMTRHVALYAITLLGAVATQGTAAHALSMAECSAKYKAAKAAGTLNGMKWNDFRKAQCGAEQLLHQHLEPHSQRRRRQHQSPPQHQRLGRPRSETQSSRTPSVLSIRASLGGKREWKLVSINTEPTRRIMQTAD